MRLIDGDLLKSEFAGNYVESYAPGEVRAHIDDAPTVAAIPVLMVKRMRDAQKRYFRTRDADALQESKWCEKEIDRLISDNGTVQSRLF